MILDIMVWQPGQSGNPAGYNGNRNYTNRHKLHREVFEQIKGLGHKDALLTLSEIQNDPNKDDGLRVVAATALAPFQHPKLQALPTPRYIATPIDVPDFQTVEDATKFLARIPVLIARGELDLDFADSITKGIVAYIQSQHSQTSLELKASDGLTGEQTIRIEGGMPALPGTNITMPQLDGNNGYRLLDQTSQTSPTADCVASNESPKPQVTV